MSKTVESFIEHWMAPCGCGGAECNQCNAIRALRELVGSLEKERNGAQSEMFHALNSRDALVDALKQAADGLCLAIENAKRKGDDAFLGYVLTLDMARVAIAKAVRK